MYPGGSSVAIRPEVYNAAAGNRRTPRRQLTHDDGQAEIAAHEIHGVGRVAGAQRILELGQGACAPSIHGVNDVSRPEAGGPCPAALGDCRDDEPLDSLIKRTAALDLDDAQAGQLCNRLTVAPARLLRRRDLYLHYARFAASQHLEI